MSRARSGVASERQSPDTRSPQKVQPARAFSTASGLQSDGATIAQAGRHPCRAAVTPVQTFGNVTQASRAAATIVT